MPYDVIVVGARCAGAPIAMLLARRGYHVLLVDAGRLPSDMPLSTHLIWQSGAAHLGRWGLLDAVAASGCPPIRSCTVDLGALTLTGTPPPADGAAAAYSPRRVVLDEILVKAAVAAGAELRDRFKVIDLLRDGGTVSGIEGTANGATVRERGRIVIGADGRTSRVAQCIRAPTYNARPRLQGTYFAYWRGLPLQGLELYVRPARGVYAWATNDGLALVGANWAVPDFSAVKGDVERHYLGVIEACAPGLRARLSEAAREGRFIGGSVRNFMRKPFGPGWALVGDAGLTVDPCTAAGINNAFRDVELLAEAVDKGLAGRLPMGEALAEYHSRRDRIAGPIYDFTCELAPFAPPTADMGRVLGALARSDADRDQFLGLFAQTVSPVDFFAPDNLARITSEV